MNKKNKSKLFSHYLFFWFLLLAVILGGSVFTYFYSQNKLEVLYQFRRLLFKVFDVFPLFLKPSSLLRYIIAEVVLLVILLIGTFIFLTLGKRYTGVIRDNVEKYPFNSFLVGSLGMLTMYFLNVLLALSIFGVPLIIMLDVGFVLAVWLGYIAMAWISGEAIFKFIFRKRISAFVLTLLGIVFIELIKALPYIGWFFYFVILASGLGSVMVTRFGTITHQPDEAVS